MGSQICKLFPNDYYWIWKAPETPWKRKSSWSILYLQQPHERKWIYSHSRHLSKVCNFFFAFFRLFLTNRQFLLEVKGNLKGMCCIWKLFFFFLKNTVQSLKKVYILFFSHGKWEREEKHVLRSLYYRFYTHYSCYNVHLWNFPLRWSFCFCFGSCTHPEQSGKLWPFWQAWWRENRCTCLHQTAWHHWCWWSTLMMLHAQARFCCPLELETQITRGR